MLFVKSARIQSFENTDQKSSEYGPFSRSEDVPHPNITSNT